MKVKYLLFLLVLVALVTSTVGAEDGLLFRRDISKTPDQETEKAAIYMMDFYVPAQSSAGEVGPVANYSGCEDENGDPKDCYEPRDYAKPLVAVYIDELGDDPGEGEGIGGSISGGLILGAFDGFAAVSLDDGTSWKRTNLSRSADLSSFTLANGQPYPGGVPNIVHQVAGDQIFVVWISKYCDGGTPLYKLGSDSNFADNVEYFSDLEQIYSKDALYLYDLFGVSGTQGSVDYTLQGHPEVGEIPYSCVWTARGKLVAGDDPSTGDGTGGEGDVVEATHVIWTKPERLTSGTRDANLPAVDCVKDAGCILTWQEDPEGLRPGQGLGPGEGWSGAIANGKTDIWYSYIAYDDFDWVVQEGEGEDPDTVVRMADYTGDTLPKIYVPMAMPIRLTDNNMCKETGSDPYCYIDFDTIDTWDNTNVQYNLESLVRSDDSTFCTETVDWKTPGDVVLSVCMDSDGRVLNGRVASTRVRLNLKPYNPTEDTVSAWVVMAYEETKAFGDLLGDDLEPIEIGKDIWYHSFDMFAHDYIAQGGILNQPAVCREYDYELYGCTVGDHWTFLPWDNDGKPIEWADDVYQTEIARRFAVTTNSVSAAVASEHGLSAMLIFKQGIINQGGPADIMLRRVVIPDGFNPAVDNPYAYKNMECDEWAYTVEENGGDNTNYLQGICLDPAINVSGTTIVTCDLYGDPEDCADNFPWDGGVSPFPKVTEWRQCGLDENGNFAVLEDSSGGVYNCTSDNLKDQTWTNPYDVAKGHRGFLDGDFVMIMYAWSPNWKANSVGNDHYNLYIRRSFDGGKTWTTTPAEDLDGIGTEAIEWYGLGGDAQPTTWVYDAGDFEQARNVSQLVGNKITILDPRYSPTGGLKLYPTIRTNWLTDNEELLPPDLPDWTGVLPYPDDEVRDPSKYFIVFETGDNTTVTEGEAVPLDLYYSRATVYGDFYEMMDYTPSDPAKPAYEYWPWLENKADDLSGEASMLANPGGTFMYAVWNQWKEEIDDDGHELIYDSDIIFRRLLYVPDGTVLSPKATILYYWPHAAGYNLGGDITFVGSGHAYGGATIVGYQWRSDLDGPLGTEKFITMPVNGFSLGLHKVCLITEDSNGRHSREACVRLLVAEELTQVFSPVLVRR